MSVHLENYKTEQEFWQALGEDIESNINGYNQNGIHSGMYYYLDKTNNTVCWEFHGHIPADIFNGEIDTISIFEDEEAEIGLNIQREAAGDFSENEGAVCEIMGWFAMWEASIDDEEVEELEKAKNKEAFCKEKGWKEFEATDLEDIVPEYSSEFEEYIKNYYSK